MQKINEKIITKEELSLLDRQDWQYANSEIYDDDRGNRYMIDRIDDTRFRIFFMFKKDTGIV